MYAAVFLVCNMLTGYCQAGVENQVIRDRESCLTYAENTRQEALDELPPSALIIYQCVEFPEDL